MAERRLTAEQTKIQNNFDLINEAFPNLAVNMDDKKLAKIGKIAVDGYLSDISSRCEWEKNQAEIAKIFALHTEPKNFPWEDCSNVAMPMMTTAAIQFQARAFEELVPSKAIVKVMAINQTQDNIEIAERKEKYFNYSLMFKDKNFKTSMDISMLKQALAGHVIRKVYYDPIKKAVVSDYVPTTDFVINYAARWLDDEERYTQRLYFSNNQIKIRENAKVFRDVGELPYTVEELDEHKLQHLKNLHLEPNEDTDNRITKRLVLEQHVFLDLDGKNGIKKPYIVTVDFATEKVFRIVSRENPLTGEVINHFVPYNMLPNPEGFYGYGFGHLLLGPNQALNSIMNQLIDSGTLQNLQTGFVPKKKGMKRGEIELSMGKFTEIDLGSTDDIRKAITQFNFGPPSQVLFAMMGTLQQYADRVSTVTEQQVGDAQKSDTTATGVALLIEQGLKLFSAIHRRNHISFQRELEKINQLYTLFIDLEDYFKVVINPDDLINPQTGEQTPLPNVMMMLNEDWKTESIIKPVSNPNIISRQEKVAKAQFLYNSAVSSPITAQNPQAIYEAQRMLYELMDVPDSVIDRLLPAPPPPPEPPDLPQEEENQAFLNDQYVDALEQQDHEAHLQVMAEFEQSPFFEEMTPTGKKFFDTHKRQHLGFVYIIQQGARQPQAQAQPAQPIQGESPA